ncbi:hypothetical protein NDG35_004653 [Salmonella enterica]|nr:hypothetical protein [Salmonella enterica]
MIEKILLQVKTVSSFRASGTGVASSLLYAALDSATLRNLKEAPVIRTVDPFTGADLCKHRVAEHCDGGSSFYHCARVLTPSAPHRNYPGQLILADIISAFISRAAACKDSRLCCRVAVKLHQNRNF